LRKVLFSLGLTILLAGLVLLGFGSVRNVKLELQTHSTGRWEVSGDLTMGHTYVMDIYSNASWQDDYTKGGYTDSQPLQVVITSPEGGETNLLAFFYAVQPSSGSFSLKSTLPSLVEVDYKSVDYDSLIVDESYPQARFTVKKGGNYTATIIKATDNWTTGPPREMVFEEEVIENQNLFTNLLQSSGVVCLFTGVVISVWMARATKKIRIQRKKKAKK
jgi:hypothetical protein